MASKKFCFDWVKRLGQWHLYAAGASETRCGKPMLGNNYADKAIGPEWLEKCPFCHTGKGKKL